MQNCKTAKTAKMSCTGTGTDVQPSTEQLLKQINELQAQNDILKKQVQMMNENIAKTDQKMETYYITMNHLQDFFKYLQDMCEIFTGSLFHIKLFGSSVYDILFGNSLIEKANDIDIHIQNISYIHFGRLIIWVYRHPIIIETGNGNIIFKIKEHTFEGERHFNRELYGNICTISSILCVTENIQSSSMKYEYKIDFVFNKFHKIEPETTNTAWSISLDNRQHLHNEGIISMRHKKHDNVFSFVKSIIGSRINPKNVDWIARIGNFNEGQKYFRRMLKTLEKGFSINNQLPFMTYNNLKKIDLECPICRENNEKIIINNCGHFLCFECFSKLQTETCPECRKYMFPFLTSHDDMPTHFKERLAIANS